MRELSDPAVRAPAGVERLVLVGFMASGKSSVGPLVAQALGWDFADLDACVEAEEGRTVARIFAESGEPWFRRAEGRMAERLLTRRRVVVATGGGWGAAPGRLDALPDGTACVWLHVSAGEAVRRAAAAPGARPLLTVADPLREASTLLEAREPRYARAKLRVDTEGRTVEDVAAEILNLLGAVPAGSSTTETH